MVGGGGEGRGFEGDGGKEGPEEGSEKEERRYQRHIVHARMVRTEVITGGVSHFNVSLR